MEADAPPQADVDHLRCSPPHRQREIPLRGSHDRRGRVLTGGEAVPPRRGDGYNKALLPATRIRLTSDVPCGKLVEENLRMAVGLEIEIRNRTSEGGSVESDIRGSSLVGASRVLARRDWHDNAHG